MTCHSIIVKYSIDSRVCLFRWITVTRLRISSPPLSIKRILGWDFLLADRARFQWNLYNFIFFPIDSSRNGAVQNQNDGEHIHDKGTVAKDNAAPRVSFSENAEMSVSIPSVNPLPRPSLVEMYTSKRWGITFLSLTVISFSMTLRMCMSMAIVCMVKPLNTNASRVINTNQSNTTYVAIDQDVSTI